MKNWREQLTALKENHEEELASLKSELESKQKDPAILELFFKALEGAYDQIAFTKVQCLIQYEGHVLAFAEVLKNDTVDSRRRGRT